jgi:hypothetical protein
MKRMQMNLAALAAMIPLAVLIIVQDAEAEVRFNAALHTPNMSVHIGNTPAGYYGSYRVGHLPMRRNQNYRIVKLDRQIARRLARYTGVPVRELTRLRAYGYNWLEIGCWLRLPNRVVRAAFNQQSWNRFLHEGRRLAGHGTGRHEHRRVIVYNH